MRHYYEVGEWNEMYRAHTIVDGDNDFLGVFCDLFIDCDEAVKAYEKEPEKLVGMKISVSHLQPFVTIGNNVKLAEGEGGNG
jgi:hypothetical protein